MGYAHIQHDSFQSLKSQMSRDASTVPLKKVEVDTHLKLSEKSIIECKIVKVLQTELVKKVFVSQLSG